MNYIDPFKAPFASPNWLKNLGLQSLCALIPVIGPIVLGGYGADVIAARALNRHAQVPDFDFNYFTRYLQRGVWPFLVGLVVGLVMLPCTFLSVIPLFLGIFSNDTLGFFTGLAAYLFLLMLSILVTQFIAAPLQLRATLLQNFSQAFNFRWVLAMLGATIVQNLVILLIGLALMLPFICLVFATFGLAAYVLNAYFMNVSWHFLIAEYYVFLDKGGEPLPVVGYDGQGQPRGFDIVTQPTPPAPPVSP